MQGSTRTKELELELGELLINVGDELHIDSLITMGAELKGAINSFNIDQVLAIMNTLNKTFEI